MKKLMECLKVVSQPNCASSALLFLRLVVGVAFILHGWGKIQSPMSWIGLESPVPGIFQFLAALSEFGGGIALIIGFLTPIASMGIGFTMLVATSMHAFVRQDPFVSKGGEASYELALVYLAICILLLMIGPGKFSLDNKIFGQKL